MYEVLLGCTIIVILVCIVGLVILLGNKKHDDYPVKYKKRK
jgi:preprotein translocase subunit SecG